MFIKTQDGKAIYDTSKFIGVYVQESKLVDADNNAYGLFLLNLGGEVAYLLGQYKRESRATEILSELHDSIESEAKYDMPIV